MNRTQMIKRAYVRGLAARGIYRARLRQKQAAGGLKNYAISGGIGAAGGGALGSLIGALVQYARGKNVLRGALAGGGIGGGLGLLGGLGYQYSKKAPVDWDKPIVVNTENGPVSLLDSTGKNPVTLNTFEKELRARQRAEQWGALKSRAGDFGKKLWKAMSDANTQANVDDTTEVPSATYESGSEPEHPMDQWNRLYTQRAEQREAENEAAADRATGVEAILDYAQSLNDEMFGSPYSQGKSNSGKTKKPGSKKSPKKDRRPSTPEVKPDRGFFDPIPEDTAPKGWNPYGPSAGVNSYNE